MANAKAKEERMYFGVGIDADDLIFYWDWKGTEEEAEAWLMDRWDAIAAEMEDARNRALSAFIDW